jgi:hypothetical protein
MIFSQIVLLGGYKKVYLAAAAFLSHPYALIIAT